MFCFFFITFLVTGQAFRRLHPRPRPRRPRQEAALRGQLGRGRLRRLLAGGGQRDRGNRVPGEGAKKIAI